MLTQEQANPAHTTVRKTDGIEEVHRVLHIFLSDPVTGAMKFWWGEAGIRVHPLHITAM